MGREQPQRSVTICEGWRLPPITNRDQKAAEIHRFACPGSPVPDGFEPGSPFGPGVCALILHLHITQAISFERLARLMAEVFGLTISEGAIANILARAQAPLLAAAAPIAQAVRGSSVVGSDETSARVRGKTWWQWVLLSSTAVYHVIADTRAASVVTTFLEGAQPEVWVADRYGGQLGHGAVRQMCLAHLLRDAKYAIEAGDTEFAPGFRLLLLRAVAIGKRRATISLKQLSAELAEHQQIAKREAETILTGLVGLLVDHLNSGDRLRIGGLGTLEVKDRPERTGRNPATGEPITIKASKKIAFRPAKELKAAI